MEKNQNNPLPQDPTGNPEGYLSAESVHQAPPANVAGIAGVAQVQSGFRGDEGGSSFSWNLVRRLEVLVIVLLLIAAAAAFFALSIDGRNAQEASLSTPGRYSTVRISLEELTSGKDLTISGLSGVTINGDLRLNDTVVMTPSLQPTAAEPGQLYYDRGTNQLAYFNGNAFVFLTGPESATGGVQSLGGATGQLTLGSGFGLTGSQLNSTGVLAVQGQTGNVTFAAGAGIAISGTNFSNTGVISVSAGTPNVAVSTDGAGNVTISVASAGAGTVSSPGGTAGTVPLFTGAQTIEDSIIIQSGLTVSVAGALNVNTNIDAAGTFAAGTADAFQVAVGGDITTAGSAVLQGGVATIGAVSQAGTLVLYDGGAGVAAHTATFRVISTLAQDTTYILPDPGSATTTICLTTGNCAGFGGGVTTGGGATNRLAKFSGSQVIADSTISDDGANVITSVDMIIQGGELTTGTTSQAGSLILHDGDGQTTTVQAGDSSGNLTFILPTSAGTANQCLKQSGTGNQLVWQDCDGGSGGSSGTLQTAYSNGNTLTTSNARDIDIVLAATGTDSLFDLIIADGSTGYAAFSRADGPGTVDPAQIILVDNLDTSRPAPIGIRIQAAGGGMNTALDASDTEIDTALSVGANTIAGTTGNIDYSNFDVTGTTGAIAAGTYNGQTISGAASFTGTVAVANNLTLTSGDIAVNGGDITSSGALNITPGGALIIGDTGQTASLRGSVTTITSTGVGNDIILNAEDTIELQDNTNITGSLDASGTLTSGTLNAFQVAADGSITSASGALLQGGTITLGTTTQAGTVVLSDGSSHTGTIQTAALGQPTVYTLPDPGVGSAMICLSTGNCSGSGTTNTLQAAYDAGNTITATDNRNIVFTLADTATDSSFLVNLQCSVSCSTNGRFAIQDASVDVFAISPAGGFANFRPSALNTTAFSVQLPGGENLFTVDTQNSRVGINLGLGGTPTLTGAGLELQGGLRLSGGAGFVDTYTTPAGTNLQAKVNIPSYDPGAGNAIIALGLDTPGVGTASDTATGISVFDTRTNANHWPTIAVWSPDESRLLGLTWAGSDIEGRVTTHNATGTTGGIALQSGDTAGAGTVSGAVAIRSGNGVGSDNSTGAITIDSGFSSGVGTAGAITIGTVNSNAITIGKTIGSASTTIQGGTGNVNLATNAAAASVIVKSATNNNEAFKVVNGSDTALLTVKTNGTLGTDMGTYITGTGPNGAGGRLFFGTDLGDGVYIGEEGTTNTDRMLLFADAGFNFEAGAPGTSVLDISTDGLATFTASDSTNGGLIVREDATDSNRQVFFVDTDENTVQIGNLSPDSTAFLLLLDHLTSGTDPSGVEGAMYYNADMGSFRCYERGMWRDCLGGSQTGFRAENELFNGTDTAYFAFVNSGGGFNELPGEAGHPGILELETASATTANVNIDLNNAGDSGILLGGNDTWRFETTLRIPVLSDGTDTFTVRAGFTDSTHAGDVEATDGCYFKYSHGVNSGEWQGVCADAGTTPCDTNVAVAPNSWYRLSVIVNAAGTEADFQVDGISVCQVTGNIPVTTGNETGFGISLIKNATGSSNRSLQVDYLEVVSSLTPR